MSRCQQESGRPPVMLHAIARQTVPQCLKVMRHDASDVLIIDIIATFSYCHSLYCCYHHVALCMLARTGALKRCIIGMFRCIFRHNSSRVKWIVAG